MLLKFLFSPIFPFVVVRFKPTIIRFGDNRAYLSTKIVNKEQTKNIHEILPQSINLGKTRYLRKGGYFK